MESLQTQEPLSHTKTPICKPHIIIDSALFQTAATEATNPSKESPARFQTTGLILHLLLNNRIITPSTIPLILEDATARQETSLKEKQQLLTFSNILKQIQTNYVATREEVFLQTKIIGYLKLSPIQEEIPSNHTLSIFVQKALAIEQQAIAQAEALPEKSTTQRMLLNQAQTLQNTPFNPLATLQQIENTAVQIATLEIQAQQSAPIILPELQTLFLSNRYNATLHTTQNIYKHLNPFFRISPIIHTLT